MKITNRTIDFFRNTLVPKAKNMFNFKNIKLERQPKTDVLELNLIENTPGIKSKTFNELLAQKPLETNLAENGTRITTILDRKTNTPVNAYIARVEENDKDCEKYIMMVKDKKGDLHIKGEDYKTIGETYFYINKKDQMITPKFELTFINGEAYEKVHSYMKSQGNKDYKGIGVRLHQLRVERMLQNRLGNVCIVADGNSFPFHYSMGYRLKQDFRPFDSVKNVLSELSFINKKDPRYNAKFVSVGLKDDERVISFAESLENCLNDYYKTNNEPLDISPNMYLEPTSASQWIEMVKKHPILF